MEYIKNICTTLGIPLDIRRFYSEEYEEILVLYYINDVEYTSAEDFLPFLAGYLYASRKLQEAR